MFLFDFFKINNFFIDFPVIYKPKEILIKKKFPSQIPVPSQKTICNMNKIHTMYWLIKTIGINFLHFWRMIDVSIVCFWWRPLWVAESWLLILPPQKREHICYLNILSLNFFICKMDIILATFIVLLW